MPKRTYNPEDYSPETQAAMKTILKWHFHTTGNWLSADRGEVANVIEKAVVKAKKVTEEKVRAGCAAVAEVHLNPKAEADVIKITVKGGCVQDVDNLPDGWVYEVNDLDCEFDEQDGKT